MTATATAPTTAQTLLLPCDVARLAGVSGQTVRKWHKRGLIAPRFTTPNRTKLFAPEDVKHFLSARKQRQQRQQR